MTNDLHIRIFVEIDGRLESNGDDYGIEDFGGQCPQVGDQILSPWGPAGVSKTDFHDPANRTIYKIKERVFRPGKDNPSCGFVVEKVVATERELELL